MGFRIENLGILLGLFALAVPILLHLLQRSRYDTLDWGAMQFLPDSIAAQRKRWLDEILLMLMRMAMIALIVLALATPLSTSPWLAALGDHSTRDVVVILDGSYSMDVRLPGQVTPWDEAQRWVHENLDQASSADRHMFLIARRTPPASSTNLDELATVTHGNPDMPHALAEAWKHLQRSKAATKEIIVLTDRQRHGWADPATLSALESLGNQWHADAQQARTDGVALPSLHIVKIGAELPTELPNYSLAALTTSRGVAKVGHKITFRSALHLAGFKKFARPRSVKVLVDGKETQTIPLPEHTDLKDGQIPLHFQHRFDQAGRHVVSLVVDADPTTDVLAADNEQKTIVEVVKEVPILLVDGDKQLSAESSSYFLQKALAAKHAVPFSALKPSAFSGVAVIVLADVPHLEPAQLAALERHLADGGGLLILAGERMTGSRAFYNEQGWLPARLGTIAESKDGVRPEPRKFQHPALELFRATADGSMNQVRFTKWWKVSPDATVIAPLSNGDPFLLEKAYKQGRVILCTVPPDRRWNSTFPSTWEYPILMHELVYYLAGNSTLKQEASPDLRESDLTRCTDDDWAKVRERLPVAWQSENPSAIAQDARAEELWWLLLLAVLGLLCTEVWMTRRMALGRGR